MARTRIYMTLLVLVALVVPATAAEIYTAQYEGNLYSSDLDGSNPVTLVEDTRFYSLDVSGNYIFASVRWDGIYRYDLDGTNGTELADMRMHANAVTVTADSVYYIDYDYQLVRRMDYDGSNNELVYDRGTTATRASMPVVVDSTIFWVVDTRHVWSYGLGGDGTGAAELFDAGNNAGLSAMVSDGTYLYYASQGDDAIYRRNLDGTGETELTTTNAVDVSSLKVFEGTLYWADGSRNVYSMDAAGGTPTLQYDFNTFPDTGAERIFIDVVPEPTTLSLLALGGLVTLARRRRR